MKKFTLISAIVLLAIICPGQDYLINFTASGLGTAVDSVLVVNLNSGDSLLMGGADTLQLWSNTGIQSLPKSFNEIAIYPNPTNQSATIEISITGQSVTTIEIFDLSGRRIMHKTIQLSQGSHRFEISGLSTGIYFVSGKTKNNFTWGRLVSIATQSFKPSLNYVGAIEDHLSKGSLKSKSNIIQMAYEEGERLLLIGSSGYHTRLVAITPTESATINFEFIECVDADNKHYPVVTIGDQTWMAENLAWLPFVRSIDYGSGFFISYHVYDFWGYEVEYAKMTWHYKNYGVLYNWPAARSACPEGWRLPTVHDWNVLSEYLATQPEYLCNDSAQWTAKALASSGFWIESPESCTPGNDLTANNLTGFGGRPGGYNRSIGESSGDGSLANWWSATNDLFSVFAFRNQISLNDQSTKQLSTTTSNGLSVRCIKDTNIPKFSLELNVQPAEAGIASGAGMIRGGYQKSLHAFPHEGWDFTGWTDDSGLTVSNLETMIFTMPFEDVSLTANFTPSYTVNKCGRKFTDVRDGNTYKTVQIGNMCWMAENLKFREDGDMMACFDSYYKYCDLFGAIYNWGDALNACPEGWRLPSDEEWKFMEGHLDSNFGIGDQEWNRNGSRGFDIGMKLKSESGWTDNGNGINAAGFTAFPAGWCDPWHTCVGMGRESSWWTSTETSIHNACYRSLSYQSDKISRSAFSKSWRRSVRCVTDSIAMRHYSLSILAMPEGAGSLTGSGEYLYFEQVNVTAEAHEGWDFLYWTDENGEVTSIPPDFIFTMPERDAILTAVFSEKLTGFECGDDYTDPRDNKVYSTIMIDGQCWMQSNLDFRLAGGWCYDDLVENCEAYGRLYNWEEADFMCPPGWHLPSDTEWMQLIDYVVTQGFPNEWQHPNGAGNALKSCRQVESPFGGDCSTSEHPRWNQHTTHNGSDDFGFAALPGGYRNISGDYIALGEMGFWWSSTDFTTTNAWYFGMTVGNGNVATFLNQKQRGLSVRCIKNLPSNQNSSEL